MWQRYCLWAILVICAAHVISWPLFYRKWLYGNRPWDRDPSVRIVTGLNEDVRNEISLNCSWVCGTVAVVGLGVVKPKQV